MWRDYAKRDSLPKPRAELPPPWIWPAGSSSARRSPKDHIDANVRVQAFGATPRHPRGI